MSTEFIHNEHSKYDAYKGIVSLRPKFDTKYLSEILRLLDGETVRHVDILDITKTETARTIKVNAVISNRYCERSHALFIKTSRPDESGNPYHSMSMKESAFYAFLLQNNPVALPIPTCYDAFVSEEMSAFVIVLDDLSASYHAPALSELQNEDTWLSCAESLAKFHSFFWNDPIIGSDAFPTVTDTQLETEAQSQRETLSMFIAKFRDRFDDSTIAVFERALAINIELIAEQNHRTKDLHNITICHGDSHIHNFMIRNDNSQLPVMVDSQFWGHGIGTGDLAHLTRVAFPEIPRAGAQTRLVERYHNALAENGVSGYSPEDCLADYRKAVASMVLIPMWQHTGFGLPYEAWSDDVRGLIDNYRRMDCDAVYNSARHI